MLFWLLADLVLAIHVALFVVLGVGVVLAALGLMRHHRRMNLFFWPTFVISIGWAMVPVDCPITELEVWLRQLVEPDWARPQQLPPTVGEWLTGVALPRRFFMAVGGLLFGLAIFGFWRSYWGRGSISGPNRPIAQTNALSSDPSS